MKRKLLPRPPKRALTLHVLRMGYRVGDGLLKAGGSIRTHDVSDPEIVLVDTDGQRELAQVRRVKPSAVSCPGIPWRQLPQGR